MRINAIAENKIKLLIQGSWSEQNLLYFVVILG